MTDIKQMDIAEFVAEGYLQELNRQFLHPLGLALEVVVDENRVPVSFGRVWDARDDPEGMIFAEGLPDSNKASRISQIMSLRKAERMVRLGYWIQPVDAN